MISLFPFFPFVNLEMNTFINYEEIIKKFLSDSIKCLTFFEESANFEKFKFEIRLTSPDNNEYNGKRKKVLSNEVNDLMFSITQELHNSIALVSNQDIIKSLQPISEFIVKKMTKDYFFYDGTKVKLSSSLVSEYPDSLFYINFIDNDSRENDGMVCLDMKLKYVNIIVQYMKKEKIEWSLNGKEFDEFCLEMITMRIPFREDILSMLCNGTNAYGVYWLHRCMIVNDNEYKTLFSVMKSQLQDLNVNDNKERIELYRSIPSSSTQKILNDFELFLKDPAHFKKNPELNVDDIHTVLSYLDINLSVNAMKDYLLQYSTSLFCYNSKLLENTNYDSYLREWIGDKKVKLIYRASEHDYTAKSFHECCDDHGPTLILFKSTEGFIFGGYTTRSWKVGMTKNVICR